ncbi:MAG: D-aminoacyl-tRNA deacylase [Oscillospiraceae bacterium]|nr:D-aminoacyl-tRNA deacylase [Oscillospiraceae bacterium]
MRIILQRVNAAAVTINGKDRHAVGAGLAALVGFGHGDSEKQADYLAAKMAELRIFNDENGQMNRSLLDIGGECLIVPNFTLYANAKKGRRPSFTDSMEPGKASALFDYFVDVVKTKGVGVKTGEFGASMLVEIENNGPVTIILDTDEIMPAGK